MAEAHVKDDKPDFTSGIFACILLIILIAGSFLIYNYFNMMQIKQTEDQKQSQQQSDKDGDSLSDYDEINVYHTDPNSIYTSKVVVNGTYRLDDFNAIKTYGIDPRNDSKVIQFMKDIPNVVARQWNQTDFFNGFTFDIGLNITTHDPLIQWLANHSEIKWNSDGTGKLFVNEEPVFLAKNETRPFGYQASFYFTHGRSGICATVAHGILALQSIRGYPTVIVDGKNKMGDHEWVESLVNKAVYVINFDGSIYPREGFYEKYEWVIYQLTPYRYDSDWYMK